MLVPVSCIDNWPFQNQPFCWVHLDSLDADDPTEVMVNCMVNGMVNGGRSPVCPREKPGLRDEDLVVFAPLYYAVLIFRKKKPAKNTGLKGTFTVQQASFYEEIKGVPAKFSLQPILGRSESQFFRFGS